MHWHIDELQVRPTLNGQGIGTALLKHTREMAIDEGVATVDARVMTQADLKLLKHALGTPEQIFDPVDGGDHTTASALKLLPKKVGSKNDRSLRAEWWPSTSEAFKL